MRGRGRGWQFCELGGFGGQCREAFLIRVHGFDGGSCFGELSSTCCAVVTDEEEEEDGEDKGAADDAACDAGFCSGGKTGAARLEGVFESEELGAYDADVKGGIGDDIGGCWGGDKRERGCGKAGSLACEGGGVNLPAAAVDVTLGLQDS